MKPVVSIFICLMLFCAACHNTEQNTDASSTTRSVPIAQGWAASPVNVAIHRKHSLVSFAGYQYVAFYDEDARVVLGKRRLVDEQWELHTTAFSGNAADPHNTINLMVDGSGYLHMAWDHHVHPLNYAISDAPGALMMSEPRSLLGIHEDKVTYPEFYPFPDGDILMAYRHGSSGNGVMVLNRYDHQLQQWIRLHDVLLDGEGQRNPYWQLHIDSQNTIHLSWVWRESADVATNHDMIYAQSRDRGVSWQRINGESYQTPIVQSTAEVVFPIAQNSNLINQSSMTTDGQGNPWIATYWRDEADQITQIQVIGFDGTDWISRVVSNRVVDFKLGGTGSRITPLSRPLILSDQGGEELRLAVIYRDSEADNRVLMTKLIGLQEPETTILNEHDLGRWEPTYDITLWNEQQTLHLLIQAIEPVDEVAMTNPASMLTVLEFKPF